jgi:DNA-binding CsgD family transcriptional regulator
VLAAVSGQLDQGLGGCMYFADLSDPERPRYWAYTGPAHLRRAWIEWFPTIPIPLQIAAHTAAAFGTARGLGANFPGDSPLLELAEGWVDMLGINGIGPDGIGVALAFPSLHPIARPSESVGALLATLSTHLARAAARMLPFASALGPDVMPAASRDGIGTSMAASLGRAALRDCSVRAVRERRLLDPVEHQLAVERLRSRRLAIIDTFTVGERTYTIAVDPMRDGDRLETLAPREIEAARLASTGLSNKAIAEHMGVGVSTVSTLLRRAMDRLGCDSRAALIALLATRS